MSRTWEARARIECLAGVQVFRRAWDKYGEPESEEVEVGECFDGRILLYLVFKAILHLSCSNINMIIVQSTCTCIEVCISRSPLPPLYIPPSLQVG